MKITCPRKEFSEAVSAAAQAASVRTSHVALQALKIEASGSTIRITGCDGEMWIERSFSSVVVQEGAICVPARLLVEIVNSMPDGDLHIQTEDGGNVLVQHSASEYRLKSLVPEDFPEIPQFGGESNLTIQLGELRKAIDSVIFAVTTDLHRVLLTGVMMNYDGQKLTLVATDTHRLAVREISKEGLGSEVNAIVPDKALKAIKALPFGDDAQVEMQFGNGRLGVATDEAKVVTMLLSGTYPNWQRVVPSETTRTWNLETDHLESMIKRALIVAKDSAYRVRFKGTENELTISAHSDEKGDAKEELAMVTNNGEIEIAFNGKYVLDAIGPIAGPGVKVEMTEAMRPAVFRSAEDDASYFCVIMPMSLM